jgi:hypothetical protein
MLTTIAGKGKFFVRKHQNQKKKKFQRSGLSYFAEFLAGWQQLLLR